jgi:hypothetical protein
MVILANVPDWSDFTDRDNFSSTICLKTRGIDALFDLFKLACYRFSLADWIKPNSWIYTWR